MNTNQLKRFAKEARIKLIDQVGRKLEFVLNHDTAELRGKENEIVQLKQKIQQTGQDQVIEMVAYTWFNRLMALRFMDANGYSVPKVVTPLPEMTNPEILQNALGGNIENDLKLDRQRLNDLLDGHTAVADAQTEAYKMLLIAVCNKWNTSMPFMFERISDYSELLLPDDLLSDYSIVADIRNGMCDEDCQQEEILGWLYQFYISDENERLISSKKVYTKNELAPASQLFTPKWIVKYMVDNTLGQLWSEINPSTTILSQLEFYIKPPYKEQLKPRTKKKLEEIKFFDPCVGSAHILSYAFDIFYLMYEEQGYNTVDIPELIIKQNLFGTDIDERAAQIASFVLMMKGRRKNSRFLRKKFKPNITYYQDFDSDQKFKNAKAIGSLIHVEPEEIDAIQIEEDSVFADNQRDLKKLYTYLGQRYDCVVTNPPYISFSRMEETLKQYVEIYYPDTKYDLFATFTLRCLELCNEDGFTGYMTPFVWMFISSYKKLRENIIDKHFINNLVQLEYSGFDGATVPICTFTLRNKLIENAKGSYIRLSDFKGSENQAPKTFEAINNQHCGWFYIANQKDFEKIPGNPIGYWMSEKLRNTFTNNHLFSEHFFSDGLTKTGNNDKYLRFHWELSHEKATSLNCYRICVKGGYARDYFGNIDILVNWSPETRVHYRKDNVARITPEYLWKSAGISWTKISSKGPTFRWFGDGMIAETGGPAIFAKDSESDVIIWQALGFLSSKVSWNILTTLNPTLNFQTNDVLNLPFNTLDTQQSAANTYKLVKNYKVDWNESETSLDFTSPPLMHLDFRKPTLKEIYKQLRVHWNEISLEMQRLKVNNNRIFIEAYGLKDELSPEVSMSEITLNCNPHYRYGGNRSKQELETLLQTGTMKELISYAIGCILCRYSLDKPGLILANQGETLQDYFLKVFEVSTLPTEDRGLFMPDEDNIIPVLDDEWFTDDIVVRFKAFIKEAFGKEHFEENLKFIEDSIGKDIRKYIIKDFYNDHIKLYKKRPIYWMFSSPKGHFKALIYMHRYQPDLCSKLLNDYLQAFISKLEASMQTLKMFSIREDISVREKTVAIKETDKFEAMLKDCREYEKTLFTIATQKIAIDLDDGVKVNYQKFKEVLVPIKGLEKEED